MNVTRTPRGFELIEHPAYADAPGLSLRLVGQSSAVGDYPDALERPGSSFLWVGQHHLSREQVRELALHLAHWLETGRLDPAPLAAPEES
jgi:hypothetical protein